MRALIFAILTTTGWTLPAFPGAQGFGAEVSGGRGGRVLEVTNLRASGPGSLQAALDQRGPRTVVFRVSGVVQGVPELRHGDVTIAGQTSPSGVILRGLMIQGDRVEEDDAAPLPRQFPENFIVQHLRLRAPQGDGDGLRLHHARRGIIDHVSIGNARDEAVQISFTSDVTLQNCLIAETVGEHAPLGGALVNYGDPRRGFPLTRLSLHHNLFNRIVGRLPELSRESPGNRGSTMDIEISNNLYYDPGFPIWITQSDCGDYRKGGLHYRANVVGNYFWQNPQRPHSFGVLTLEDGVPAEQGMVPAGSPTLFYLADNRTNLTEASDWQLVYGCNDLLQALPRGEVPFRQAPFWGVAQRLPFPVVNYEPAGQLRASLPERVGAWPVDPMDRRLLGYLRQPEFPKVERDRNPANDALACLPARPLPKDQDRDGIPDDWERRHGLNPARADSQGKRLSKLGYTDLEVYLHQLARRH